MIEWGTKKTGFSNNRVLIRLAGALFAVGLLSMTLVAQTAAAARYDTQIQTALSAKLTAKKQFADVKASVEDGIVTLTGTVDLYQGKLDAAKAVRKIADVQGVRNLITVNGPSVPDAQLEQKLSTRLRYVRVGYDNTFDYFALGVKDGVVTVEGQDRTGIGRDEALADIANMPGVKDVIDNVTVAPVSNFDDGLRLRALRAIYRDTVLSKYAADPAQPIRIIVDNGHVTLYGSVDSKRGAAKGCALFFVHWLQAGRWHERDPSRPFAASCGLILPYAVQVLPPHSSNGCDAAHRVGAVESRSAPPGRPCEWRRDEHLDAPASGGDRLGPRSEPSGGGRGHADRVRHQKIRRPSQL